MFNPLARIEAVYDETRRRLFESRRYREARIRYRLANRELKRWNEFDVPLWKRLDCWRKGFLTRSSVIYPLDAWDHRTFITDVERERANRINARHGIATRNKLLFSRQLSSVPSVSHPTVYGIVEDETIVPEEWDGSNEAHFIDILRRTGVVVLKPIYGFRGRGIYQIRYTDAGTYLVDGNEADEAEIESLIDSLSGYLITEHVEQAGYADAIYPAATNTLRLISICPSAVGSPLLIAAVQRIGTDGTAPTDNWSNGGLAAEVDPDRGELLPAIAVRDGARTTFDRHPDTGARIAGRSVPNWESIRNRIVDAATAFPELPYLAWDVVPRDDAPPVVIEANAFPDVDIAQLREPLLKTDEVAEFFREHDVIR